MKLSKRTIAPLAAAAVLSLIALAGCSSSPEASTSGAAGKPVSLTIATDNASGALPILVGIQEGFFKEEGLDVKQQTVANITLIPAGLGKTYQLGESVGPITLTAANSGLPITAVAGSGLDAGSVVMSVPSIKTIADLKGKTIGAPTIAGNYNLATRAWLRKNGVNPDDVKFVQVPTPNMNDQLKGGLIDAAELQVPYIQLGVNNGFNNLGAMMSDAVGKDAMTTWWLANKPWAEKNKDTLVKYRAALDKSHAWMADNLDGTREVLRKFTGSSEDLVKTIPSNRFQTEIPADTMEIWGNLMKQESDFTPKVDYSSLVMKF